MPVPTPPPDASGGYFVIKVQVPGKTHRMRFHTVAFNNDATGSYTADHSWSLEASVQGTAAALMAKLAPFYSNDTSLSLDSAWQNLGGGNLVEAFLVQGPAAVAGTAVGAHNIFPEQYRAFIGKTALGGRFRTFIYQPTGWAYSAPGETSASAANAFTSWVDYLANKGVVTGHDGARPLSPMNQVLGMNRRLRRIAGDA